MSASLRNLRTARGPTGATLLGAGVDSELVDSTQLVLSERYGNAVHVCGGCVPLVAEVESTAAGV
ncbi:hypothetical protein [Streptomyces sp. NPDC002738]